MEMLPHQPPLLPACRSDRDAPQGPIDLKSPVFKGRPGWGGRLAFWLRQSPLEAAMTLLALTLITWGLWLFW